ncbi:NPAS4 protein, partial [Nothocercus julius]|nr:NPAS4 protein [Nothocercus julius]
EGRAEMVARLQRKDGLGWTWVYALVRPEGPDGPLLAHNFVISEAEAWCLRQQLEAEAPPASAPLGPPEPPLVPGLDFSGLDFPNGRGGADNLSVGANVGVNVGVNVGPNVGVNVGVNIGPANVGVNIAPNIGA